MTEEKRKIRGVEVVFPCKPYPSQFSFMDKVIQGIEKRQNCLLESPTGSGKSLALLCSALAWQTSEYDKKRQEEISSEKSKSSDCCCKQKEAGDVHRVNHDTEEFRQTKPIPSSHISINVIKGQIAHQQSNVIVNTTSTSLQLNYGAVSQSLLCVGGPVLQKECNQKYPNGIQLGEIAETSGGNLKCDVVFHGALPQWKEEGSLDLLQTFMKNCLTVANDNNYTSVAFPALGTGSLGYPRDVVASEMFSCVDEFARTNPTSSVTDVRFVVYSGDSSSVKAFEEKQSERQRGNQKWLEQQMENKVTVTPDSKSMSTIVIPESDDEDDDFKKPSKFRTPGSVQSVSSKIRKHQSISYETSPPCEAGSSNMEDEPPCNCTCGSENKHQSRKVPKIYFGTRTHKQISQIVRELKKTAYREARMTILASREHTCIHPEVSKTKTKNEGCKELMDGPGCKYNDRVKKIFPHYSKLQEYGLSEAWDLEDLVDLCRPKKVCPYFSVRSYRKEVDIVFCPYNYLIDPVIRNNMEISLKDQIVILDEAHNIEDAAREGASDQFTDEQLDKAYKEIHEMVIHEIKPVEHLRLQQMVEGFMKLIHNNMDQLEQKDFDQAAKVWSGFDIVVRMKEYGIGPEHYDHLMKCFTTVCEDMMEKTVKNVRGQTVKLSSATLSTMERMFKTMDFMYRHNLKFVEDYRVAILKSTSYVSDKNTDGAWISARNRRGGMKTMPKYIITLHFWCMNPGVAFSDLNDTRCIVLTSGTLSPMNSFESELGTSFPIKLEANHVIEDKQVWVGAMSQGPTGKPLHAVYKTMETLEFQDELGKMILQVCQEVPHGVLCFLPSYRSLEKFTERWKLSGIYEKISKIKKIIQEPRRSDEVDFDELMKYFYDTIHGVNDEENDEDTGEETTGALFLAVCRGKVSEGLDFADNFARAVITVGIPYPNWKDIQVGQKRMYNDKHKNDRGLLSGSEWYDIQAFRALNQALGRCIRHRKDWGLLILADERFVKQKDKYCKGLSKWVRTKVQAFTNCKQAMESISTFAKQRMKDMPVINQDTSFILGTPVAPGQNLSKRQSLHGAISTPMTPVTPAHTSKISPDTPSLPDSQTPRELYSRSPQMTMLQQPQFSSPEPARAVPAVTLPQVAPGYKLMSPTEVKKSAALTAAARLGNIIQAEAGQQTQILLNHQQPTTVNQGQQVINSFLTTSTYQYILSVMNSPLVPKDKPYYIIVDEGTPNQQMYLVQPNQGTSTNGQIILTDSTTTKQCAQTMLPEPVTNQEPVRASDQPQIKSQRLVSLLNGSQQVSTSGNSGPTSNIVKTDSTNTGTLSTQSLNQKAGQQKLKQNKLFKYCNIPVSTSDNDVTSQSKDGSKCPETPTLFDTQESEQECKQAHNSSFSDLPQTNCVGVDNVAELDIGIKNEKSGLNEGNNSEFKLHKKPIFKRHSVAPTITVEDDSQDDFKDQSKTRRKSCDNKILAEIQQNTLKINTEEEKLDDGENESEEILKTRRKNRGAKRKSNSNIKPSVKKPKGVDFLDNIEDKKAGSKENLIKCKSCGEMLVSQLEEFEKRKRYPNFVKLLTTTRNSEIVFFSKLEINKTNLQVVSTKLKEDSEITLNSFVDSSTGSVLQYLSCCSCTKNVIGIQVIGKSQNCKDLQEEQAWIVTSLVEIS